MPPPTVILMIISYVVKLCKTQITVVLLSVLSYLLCCILMKATTRYYPATRQPAYPNAATRRELLHKLLDYALVTVSGIGIGAMLLLALALS